MAEWKEASIHINNEPVSVAEAMTIRVAIGSFLMQLQSDGLGDDETGKMICDGYKLACQRLLSKMSVAAGSRRPK